jgi:hypothetical protein
MHFSASAKRSFALAFGALGLIGCGGEPAADGGKALPYAVVERNDASIAERERMNHRVVLKVDRVPTEAEMRVTVHQVWEDGGQQYREFTVFAYLPGLDTHGPAFAIAEYTPSGLAKFRLNETALYGTKWRPAEVVAGQADSAWQVLKESSTARDYHLSVEISRPAPRRLAIEAETDFPDGTLLFVSVGRDFFEKGNSETYSGEIFGRDVPVQDGRVKVEVEADDRPWYTKRQEDERRFAGMGVFGEIGRISDSVDVRVLYSPRRSQPAHVLRATGHDGEHVRGEGAERSGTFTTYTIERRVRVPFRN